MVETKKIVLIIGNGFDLDLGRKTSYRDFWGDPDFCPKSYPAPIINHLNEISKIDTTDLRWFDLENELLKYCQSHVIEHEPFVRDPPKFQDFLNKEELMYVRNLKSDRFGESTPPIDPKILESLINKHVVMREDNSFFIPWFEDLKQDFFWRDKKAVELIKERIIKFILKAQTQDIDYESTAYRLLSSLAKQKSTELTVYSFNYTDLPHPFDKKNHFNHIQIHGSCRHNNIILGTQDEDIFEQYDFLMKAMDNNYKPTTMVESLLEAERIIIYGHSLGLSDRQYFEPFFLQQAKIDRRKRKKIDIYTKDESSVTQIRRLLNILTHNNLSLLLNLNDIQFITTAS